MSKYGLQIRVKASSSDRLSAARPPPSAFLDNDDDEDDVERDISRQASKNKSNKDYEEMHRKALEEDPSVFEYDGVIDDIKQDAVRTTKDKQKREPKYIHALIKKAKVREREHEIVYEKKIAKERSKDDHLYEGKDKFVTAAYKKKLAEQSKWLEEERLRELREQKEDITKKGDMSDFYFNLSKNVAFGAGEAELRKKKKKQYEEEKIQPSEGRIQTSESSLPSTKILSDSLSAHPGEDSRTPVTESLSQDEFAAEPVAELSSQDKVAAEPVTEQPKRDHHKRNEDAVAAAKERFLARKKAKVVDEPL